MPDFEGQRRIMVKHWRIDMKNANTLKNRLLLLAIGWGFYLAAILTQYVVHAKLLSSGMYALACFFFVSVIVAYFIPNGD